MTKKSLTPLAVVAALAWGTTAARAADVSTLDGTMAFYNMNVIAGGPAGAVGNTINLTAPVANAITVINGAPIVPNIAPTIFGFPLTGFQITGVTATPGATTYSLSQLTPATETILFPPALGGGSATFLMSLTEAIVPTGATNTIILSGSKTLLVDLSPNFDFPGFAPSAGGTVDFTLNAAPQFDFNVVLSNGLGAFGSGSFSEAAGTPAVPEPSTLALLGMVLPVGGLYWLRRRQTANA